MINPGLNRYKTVQVRTSSPSELLTMLYDGSFRFLNEAVAAMEKGDRGRAGERLDRAYAILSEFAATLKHEVWPDLCQNLNGVYMFCMGHLVQANIDQDPEKVREVIRILEPLREAFKEAARQVLSGEAKLVPHASATKR
ncbi:MAG: flagellar export chaperone FliS [Myxococcales bacterium]|nr:flagellar export chaperone FliS [Myxococcales bacterium]